MQHPHRAQYHRSHRLTVGLRVLYVRALFIALFFGGMSTAQAGQLSLTWQDNSDNEDGFEVERALLGGDYSLLASVGVDVESHTDESVVPGREYEYRVRAFNAFGYSGYTNVSVGMMPNTAPVVGQIESVSILKGEALPIPSFAFSDAESAMSELVVEALSSNLTLLPLEGIAVSLGQGTGNLSLSPNSSSTGSAVVTLLVSDGVEIAQRAFTVEILKNLAPTISAFSAVTVYDGSQVGPISFTISDTEYDASRLSVTATSSNESIVASSSIKISGEGATRRVSFSTLEGASGKATVRVQVSDGYNQTNGALVVNVTENKAPTILGLQDLYTLEDGGKLSALAFTIGDKETSASNLAVAVSSSNAAIVSPQGLRLKGTGTARTLDVTPNVGIPGSADITVVVSDGIRSTQHKFTLRVLPAEAVVKIIKFTVEDSLAVIEVGNRPGATFTLWKIHSLDGAWTQVQDLEVMVDATSTVLIDPTPIDAAVCYRVIASE